MEKNILIAGKDLPSSADFAESFALANYGVVVAGKIEDNNSISPSGVIVAPWNKTSAVFAAGEILLLTFVLMQSSKRGKIFLQEIPNCS